jgi:hypothetical protein
MQPQKTVIFDLNEHDASQLLSLIKKEISQEDKIWQPYWKRLAETVEFAIENSARSRYSGKSSCFNRTSDR